MLFLDSVILNDEIYAAEISLSVKFTIDAEFEYSMPDQSIFVHYMYFVIYAENFIQRTEY